MQNSDFPKKRLFLICLSLLLIGIPPRLFGLFESLWLDEALMAWRTENLHAVFFTMDGSPPMFPLWVWSSRQVFGPDPWAMRLPSLVFGALLAPSLFVILADKIPTRWALFSATLAVVNPFSLKYSIEAKAYAACSLFALLSFGTLWRMLSQPERTARWERWTFLITTAILPSLHHWGAFTVAGEGVLLTFWFLKTRTSWHRHKSFYLTILAGWVVGTFGFIMQLPLTLQAKTAVQNATSSPAWPHHGIIETLEFVLGSHISFPASRHSATVAACLLTVALIVTIVATQSISKGSGQWAWMLIFTTVITLVVQAATYHFFSSRFETAYLGLVLAFYALSLNAIQNLLARSIFMIILVGLQVAAVNNYQKLLPRSNSGHLTTQIIREKPQAVIVSLWRHFDPVLQAPLAYHLHKLNDNPVPLLEFPTLETIRDAYYPPTSYYAQWYTLKNFDIHEVERKLKTKLEGLNRVGVIAWSEQAETFNHLFRDWKAESIKGFKSAREQSAFLIIYVRAEAPPSAKIRHPENKK